MSPKSARSTNRASWKTDAPVVILEGDITPRTTQVRTHDVRRELSELQSEYTKQGELLKKTLSTLKSRDKEVKRLEGSNTELENEVKELRTKLIEMEQGPGLLHEELVEKQAEIEALEAKLAEKILETERKISQLQSELMSKEQEISTIKDAAKQVELETKQRMEVEMDRLSSILAQSSEKLQSLQRHLQQTETCICREIQLETVTLGGSLPDIISRLREDILFVKFELEGLNKIFSDLSDGGKFQITSLLNRTFILRPRDSQGLQQCVEGVEDIKRILIKTKEAVARLYVASSN